MLPLALLFMAIAPEKGAGASAPASEWRGFSAGWMAFYFTAFAILYAAAIEPLGPRCVNGHPLSSGTKPLPTVRPARVAAERCDSPNLTGGLRRTSVLRRRLLVHAKIGHEWRTKARFCEWPLAWQSQMLVKNEEGKQSRLPVRFVSTYT